MLCQILETAETTKINIVFLYTCIYKFLFKKQKQIEVDLVLDSQSDTYRNEMNTAAEDNLRIIAEEIVEPKRVYTTYFNNMNSIFVITLCMYN